MKRFAVFEESIPGGKSGLVFKCFFFVFFRQTKSTKIKTKSQQKHRAAEWEFPLAAAQTAFDCLPDVAFFAKDKAGRFVAANPAFIKLCGLSLLSELMGKTDLDFFQESLARSYMHDDRKVIETGAKLENHIEPKPQGKFKNDLVITSKFPLRSSSGRIVGLVGISRNLSEAVVKFAAIDAFAKTIDHIERFCREPFDLPAMAARQGMSPSKFERDFKKHFHMTPVAYHQQARLRQARNELLTSIKSIGEIALEFGFFDQSHFTKKFVALYGVTPLRFRKNFFPEGK